MTTRTYQTIVMSPIRKTSDITAAGEKERLSVRLQIAPDSLKNPVDGIAITPGTIIPLVVTDPAKFDLFTPGASVSVAITL